MTTGSRFVRSACLHTVCAFALTAICGGASAADPPARIPIEAFFRNPDISAAKLSPSGRWIAVAASVRTGRTFLTVLNVDGGPMKATVVANFSDGDINSFAWVNDDRLVFNTWDTQLPLNDQRFGPGLFSVRRDGSEMRTLIRGKYTPVISEGNSRIVSQILEPNHALLTTTEDGSDDVVVGEYRFNETGELTWIVPKRLNVVTGRATSLGLGTPPRTLDWVFDAHGDPRVATSTEAGQTTVNWRESVDKPWKVIARFPELESQLDAVEVDAQNRLYVLAPSAAGYSVLKRFDFASGKPEPDALVSTPGFDLNARRDLRDTPLHLDRKTGNLAGVDVDTDAKATVWLDPTFKAIQGKVDARLPGRVNALDCRRCDGEGAILVRSASDQDPGAYYLYWPKDDRWQDIGRTRSAIAPAQMAQKDLHRTRARDGEDLPIWVTAPREKSDKPRPAIVLVHGGPWVRGGHWTWDAEAQFLASRGYVVLEPEYRGSTGYGLKHQERGFKQWGLAMQDDLADAVKWAVDQRIVDPKRVCIAGASYGGYATYMGLVRHPDVFKCGVAWVGVSEPRLLYESTYASDISLDDQLYSLPTMLGDPVKDAALLKEASAVEHAKQIRAPLLMAYGGNDRRVPLEHGSRLRDAMQSAGLKPEYVVYDGEGHGFLKVENRIDFWTRVEKFLAANLQ